MALFSATARSLSIMESPSSEWLTGNTITHLVHSNIEQDVFFVCPIGKRHLVLVGPKDETKILGHASMLIMDAVQMKVKVSQRMDTNRRMISSFPTLEFS